MNDWYFCRVILCMGGRKYTSITITKNIDIDDKDVGLYELVSYEQAKLENCDFYCCEFRKSYSKFEDWERDALIERLSGI